MHFSENPEVLGCLIKSTTFVHGLQKVCFKMFTPEVKKRIFILAKTQEIKCLVKNVILNKKKKKTFFFSFAYFSDISHMEDHLDTRSCMLSSVIFN